MGTNINTAVPTQSTNTPIRNTPTPRPTLTPLPPTPDYVIVDGRTNIKKTIMGLEDVSCGPMELDLDIPRYPIDDLIVGESTIDDFLISVEPATAEIPIRDGYWTYYNLQSEPYYLVGFLDGLLERLVLFFESQDPRKYLGNIINQYGTPAQVTWMIQEYVDPMVLDVTYLFIPESNAVVSTYRQATFFQARTYFEEVTFYPQEYYNDFFNEIISEKSTRYEYVEHFSWPCEAD